MNHDTMTKALVKWKNYRFWEVRKSKRAVVDYPPPKNWDCTICNGWIVVPRGVPRNIRCGHYVHWECLDKIKLVGCGHCMRLYGDSYDPKIDKLAIFTYETGPFSFTDTAFAK